MSLAPPPFQAWSGMPSVWQRWFQAVFMRVGGSNIDTLAPLASPVFTGNPRAPTPTVDDNDTSIATSAFVLGQASSAAPAMDGSAAAGASTRYARADHVHPTDTSRAPLASPAFTGTPTAPTPAAGDNSTQIATTAFLAAALSRATVDVTSGAPGSVAAVGSMSGFSGVSLETSGAGVRCVRFTFSTEMADTNYVVAVCKQYLAGTTTVLRQLYEAARATTHVDIGWHPTVVDSWAVHVDDYTHRFGLLVYR